MEHTEKVKKLQAEFLKINGPFILGKKTSNLFRPLQKAHQKLDVSHFTSVLSVKDGLVDVEGMTTFEKLIPETLKYGFIPQVTIELKTITVGGAVSGVALESSSFKYGLFHQTVVEMEVLLGSGEVVVCSREVNPDLFFALPNSYGTLGLILRLKIKLTKAKPYVHLEYLQYDNSREYLKALEKLAQPDQDHDFLEGVVFGKKQLVLSVGKLVDTAPYNNDYTYRKIYYQSLKNREEDYLKVDQFLFRWDPDWWWGTKGGLMDFLPTRLLLGKWFLHSKNQMKLLRLEQNYRFIKNLSAPKEERVIQDIGIPPGKWEEFLDFLIDKIGILPIWLCPFLATPDFKLFPLKNNTYLDYGFWGAVPKKESDHYWNRLVEQKTFATGGIKSLYSDVTYTENEFWKNSDQAAYKVVKQKYDPSNKLGDLYKKVSGLS